MQAGGRILVHVHQVVRDMAGAVIADGHVGHRFTIESGLIRTMEVCLLPSPGQGPSEAARYWVCWGLSSSL